MSLPELNLLVAYPYWSKQVESRLIEANKEFGGKINLLIDSGAFTAYNSGKEIQLSDYLKFISNLKIKPTRYLALDKIGDEVGTMKNLEESYRLGFNPMPVFTYGQDLNDIDKYYEWSDYIAYGGLVGKPAPVIAKGVSELLDITKERKVHLLGYTSMPYIKHFKPYSCDSSSWSSALRFGTIALYMGNGKQVMYNKKKLRKYCPAFAKRAMHYGFDADLGSKASHWKGGNSLTGLITAMSWVDMSIDCEKKLGTKLYLAFAGVGTLDIILNAYRKLYV